MQLVVGRVVRPHGVRGEVAVDVRTDDPEARLAVGKVLTTEPPAAGPLTIAGARWHAGRLLLLFDAVTTREQAEQLRALLLVVDSDDLEDIADPDEFRDHELIGLAVIGPDGERVGEVTDVLHYGQDLLVVAGSGRRAGSEIMVPFVTELVPDVDLAAGRLVIHPPPGLLDPDEAV
jgi:16S rRNA processing protein RimM